MIASKKADALAAIDDALNAMQKAREAISSKKVNQQKRAGRPIGSRTQFYGLQAFCEQTGYGKTYAHEVLKGKRTSAPVRIAWARWKAANAASK